MTRVVLVSGGARAGKSRWAEARLAELAAPPWRYLATAEPRDDEMRARIAAHQARRGPEWHTLEAPLALAATLRAAHTPALVDCVTLWLTNHLLAGAGSDGDTNTHDDATLLAAVDELAAAARAVGAPVVLVTNEVGSGIVPDHPLGRRFRDLAGWANQRLAAAADEVVLVSCGLPLRLK